MKRNSAYDVKGQIYFQICLYGSYKWEMIIYVVQFDIGFVIFFQLIHRFLKLFDVLFLRLFLFIGAGFYVEPEMKSILSGASWCIISSTGSPFRLARYRNDFYCLIFRAEKHTYSYLLLHITIGYWNSYNNTVCTFYSSMFVLSRTK